VDEIHQQQQSSPRQQRLPRGVAISIISRNGRRSKISGFSLQATHKSCSTDILNERKHGSLFLHDSSIALRHLRRYLVDTPPTRAGYSVTASPPLYMSTGISP
jgi:hypothetical protein